MSASEVLKLVGSNIVTLIVGYMMFANNASTNSNALLATLLERIEVVEKSNAAYMSQLMVMGVENVELKAEIANLKGELKANVTRTSLYQNFLDGLPFPAWIKKKDPDGEFRMVMINNAYSHKFNVSKDRYQGATDKEIWGEHIASGFRLSDERVFSTKGYVLTREYFPKEGLDTKPAWHSVWKFSLRLGRDVYGVGGVVVVDFMAGDPAVEAEQRSKLRVYDKAK